MENGEFTYCFDQYTLDPAEFRLNGPNGEVYLRRKSFLTLLFLVEQSGHLVTKQALFDHIWPDVVVTDNALTRCIKEIRKALGDDASNPRFLKTIPRMGYKFIAEVKVVGKKTEEKDSVPASGEKTEKGTGSPYLDPAGKISEDSLPNLDRGEAASRFRKTAFSGIAIAAITIFIAVFVYLNISDHDTALGFQARDWVLIADFENLTGEVGLEVALRVALTRELSLSQYVNSVPIGRVVDTLRLMKLDASSPIPTETAREVCLRDGGIRALISGSIQKVGQNYQISLELIEPASGEIMEIIVGSASDDDEIISIIRQLAGQLREILGESIETITRSEISLSKATTPSFSALVAYSKGRHLYENCQFNQAAIHFDQAVSIDPEFATAYLTRAWNRSILGQDWRGDIQRAAELSDSLVQRERLPILTWKALFIDEDPVQAIQLTKVFVREYPDDYEARFLAGYLSLVSGDLKDFEFHMNAVQVARPMDVTSRFWKGLSILLVEGDWNRANQQAREILEINPRYPAGFPYFAGPCKDWMDGEMSAARSGYWNILESTFPRLGPIFQVGIRQFIARFFFFNGETDLTLKLLETSEWMVPRLSDEIIANHHQLERSFVYQELGDINTSLNLLKQASESNQGIRKVESLGWLGILLAKQGDFSGAEKARKQLLEDETELSVGFFAPPLPREKKRAQNAFSEQILGEIANSKGENDRAVGHFLEVLRLVPPRGSTFLSALNPRLFLTANESLAAIYTRTGEVEKGIEALRAILRNKGLIATTAAAGRIWLRALNSIIPLLVENGQETEAREYRGYLEQIQQSS